MNEQMERRAFIRNAGIGLLGASAITLSSCASKDSDSLSSSQAAQQAKEAELVELPPSEPDPDSDFGVDKNINMDTIDVWLEREDVAYRDVRMLIDPADYGQIGGDPKLSSTIKGFKIVPYPYIGTLKKLPVEGAYTGNTLFDIVWNEDRTIKELSEQYAESMLILKDLFPQDKAIFLMCGGGGYSAMCKSLLIHLGWDGAKLYNIGAQWFYEGSNPVEFIVYPPTPGDEIAFATWRADYAYIDFNLLHRLKGTE